MLLCELFLLGLEAVTGSKQGTLVALSHQRLINVEHLLSWGFFDGASGMHTVNSRDFVQR